MGVKVVEYVPSTRLPHGGLGVDYGRVKHRDKRCVTLTHIIVKNNDWIYKMILKQLKLMIKCCRSVKAGMHSFVRTDQNPDVLQTLSISDKPDGWDPRIHV